MPDELLTIGRGGNRDDFGGTIDEVAVYGYALNADQVAAHYLAGTTTAPVVDQPAVHEPPVVTGLAGVAETLHATRGTWLPVGDTYELQWQRCDATGSGCGDIAGATGLTYVPGADDVGSTLRLAVTATNAGGSVTAETSVTDLVASERPPNVTTSPHIDGTTTKGWVLTADDGEWSGPGLTISRQWQRCDADGSNCADIPGATGPTYTIAKKDIGHKFRSHTTATNDAGSSDSFSSTTDVAGDTDRIDPPGPDITAIHPYNGAWISAYRWWPTGHSYGGYWLMFRLRTQGGADGLWVGPVITKCFPNPYYLAWVSTCGDNSPLYGLGDHGYDVGHELETEFAQGPGQRVTPSISCAAECWFLYYGSGLGHPRPCAGKHGLDAYRCFQGLQQGGDPVDLVSGSFITEANDLALPGRGTSFSFDRNYASGQVANSELGAGWTDNLSASLYLSGDGSITVTDDNGNTTLYRPDAGGYLGPDGVTTALVAVSGGYELRFEGGDVERFDSAGRLVAEHDRHGDGLVVSYNAAGDISEVTDAAGRVVTFTHDSNDLLTRIELADGRHVDYTYDDRQRLRTVTGLRGGVTTYGYSDQGKLDTIVDPDGHTTVSNVYTDGRLTAQTDALGHTTTFAWDEATRTATSTDARGHEWTDAFDADGNLLTRTDPTGNATHFAYDANGNLAIAGTGSHAIGATWDSAHHMTELAVAGATGSSTATYDSAGNPTTLTDPTGHSLTYDYNTAGDLMTAHQLAGTGTVSYGLNSHGEVTTQTDPAGHVTTYGYDSAGNLDSVTSQSGADASLAHDDNGRLTGVTAGPIASTYEYNAADQVTKITDALGHATTLAYDAVGNLTSRTDANAHTIAYAYDDANELSSVTTDAGAVTTYTYDAVGNLATRIDPDGHTTTYTYDDANRLVGIDAPLGHWELAYDGFGNQTTTVTPSGGTITNHFDDQDRLMSVTYSDGTPSVSYVYDDGGLRTSMTDASGTTTYTYDDHNRLASVTHGTDTTSYAYNANGQVATRTYPDGRVVHYAYDVDRQLASVTVGADETAYGYETTGLLHTSTLPNGVVDTRTYDAAGRLTSIVDTHGGTTLVSTAYEYDAVGNPISKTTLDGVETYSYDGDNRLVEFCRQASCNGSSDPYVQYAYDANGNRTSATTPAGTTTYTYNASDELVSASGPGGSVSFGYDANGNETSAPGWVYSYDLANQLVSATHAGVTTTYVYDGDGNRVSASDGVNTTSFLWDESFGLPQLVVERDGAGSSIRSYVYGPQRISVTNASGQYFYGYDALGSATTLTDDRGALVASYSFDPYGNVLTSTGSVDNPMRFAGEYQDAASGLYNLRARSYDTATGRFGGLDPLAHGKGQGAQSSYLYAGDSPTSFVDPSGMGQVHPNTCGGWGCFFKQMGEGCTKSAQCLVLVGVSLIDPMLAPEAEELALGELALSADSSVVEGGELRLVIGRMNDLEAPGAIGEDEYTLLEKLTPDLGSPRANWYRNASVLRGELRAGVKQIRDASPGDREGQFLNAERNLLENRGWVFDSTTNRWMP